MTGEGDVRCIVTLEAYPYGEKETRRKGNQTVGCYTPSEIVGYTESIESVMRTSRRVWLHTYPR